VTWDREHEVVQLPVSPVPGGGRVAADVDDRPGVPRPGYCGRRDDHQRIASIPAHLSSSTPSYPSQMLLGIFTTWATRRALLQEGFQAHALRECIMNRPGRTEKAPASCRTTREALSTNATGRRLPRQRGHASALDEIRAQPAAVAARRQLCPRRTDYFLSGQCTEPTFPARAAIVRLQVRASKEER
jgi:hypothetical protein